DGDRLPDDSARGAGGRNGRRGVRRRYGDHVGAGIVGETAFSNVVVRIHTATAARNRVGEGAGRRRRGRELHGETAAGGDADQVAVSGLDAGERAGRNRAGNLIGIAHSDKVSGGQPGIGDVGIRQVVREDDLVVLRVVRRAVPDIRNLDGPGPGVP